MKSRNIEARTTGQSLLAATPATNPALDESRDAGLFLLRLHLVGEGGQLHVIGRQVVEEGLARDGLHDGGRPHQRHSFGGDVGVLSQVLV